MSTVITGTSRGIGNYLSKYYLDLGHSVVGISRTKSDIKHPNYREFLADITDDIKISTIFKEIGSVRILINNAGISSMNHTLLTPVETARLITDTNFLGTFITSKEAAKSMLKIKFGRIINFSTVAYPLDLQGEAIYSASKGAIESLTRTMAYELGSFGITVNAVGPTPIMTDLIKSVPESKLASLVSKQAIWRFATMEDIANVIDFFISPDSSFITGQTIYLGGIS